MSYCPECGKRVAPTAKFCRNCGASQLEELPSTTHETSLQAATRTCTSCGNPLGPDEKFCGVCGAKDGEPVPPAPLPVSPSTAQSPAPAAPAPAVSLPTATCTVCGMPLGPGTMFCGGCGTPVREIPVAAPAPVPDAVSSPPPPPYIPPPEHLSRTQGTRLCRSCGYTIQPGDKFCKKCLAKVTEGLESSTTSHEIHAPAVSPPPPPPEQPASYTAPAAQPPGNRLCRSCGYTIQPGDKFCKKCLAKVTEGPESSTTSHEIHVPAVSPPPPPPEQPASYTAPAAQPPGTRLCRSCGYTIQPGDKFCKKCLAKVADFSPYVQTTPDLPAPQVPPLPVTFPVCRSCGSPITGMEKFCGICGTPTQPAAPPSPAASLPEKMACARCGAPVSATTKFCGSCGTAVGGAFATTAVPPAPSPSLIHPIATPVTSAVLPEEVTGVIGNARKMKMFGASWDTYTIIVTNRRMIIAQMTQALLNAAIMEAQSKAKAEGKGFFAIMKDQMAAQFRFALRYETMPPDASLAETPGNVAIENSRISAITLKLKDSGSGDMEYSEFRIIIESSGGKSEYLIAEDDRFINLLKTVYGEKVHMPFGYFRAGGMRLKFF